jgi:hypothetical protein
MEIVVHDCFPFDVIAYSIEVDYAPAAVYFTPMRLTVSINHLPVVRKETDRGQ